MIKVLKNKLFMTLFVSDMISDFGDVLYYLALMNYVLIIPETQIAMSLITLSETLPILTTLFMGIKADRTKKKVNTIMYTLIFRIVLYAIIGFVMGFSPSLCIVIVAIVLNLCSDLAGQYESYLYIPISLKIVSQDDREASVAFRQSIGSILKIAFQSSGAVLILVMSYQQLAYFNAVTFLVSLLIILSVSKPLKKLLNEQSSDDIEQVNDSDKPKEPWWETVASVIKEARQVPSLMTAVLVISFINALLSSLGTVFVMMLKQVPTVAVISNEVSIAGLSIIILSGSILGSLLVTSVFKKLTIITTVRWVAVIIPFLYISLLLKNGYSFFIVLFLLTMSSGIISPKLTALIFQSISEQKLSTFVAGMNLLLQVGIIGSQIIMSGLVLLLPIQIIVILLLVFSLGLLVYTVLQRRQMINE